jgi:hypothetical protein
MKRSRVIYQKINKKAFDIKSRRILKYVFAVSLVQLTLNRDIAY